MSTELGPNDPRCIDCVPFQEMGKRVGSLEGNLSALTQRVGTMDDRLIRVETEVKNNGVDVKRLVSWLLGNGKDDGFKVEWAILKARVEEHFSFRDRIKYIAIGVLVTGGIGGAVTLVRAAIVRGIL